ncbi:MAG: hypothetical protein HDT30_12720 [Clostridiales bacterium]|nr:hypothetical protein [Clostridiales bacterium]
MCFKKLMGMVVITSVATLTVAGNIEIKAVAGDNIGIIEKVDKLSDNFSDIPTENEQDKALIEYNNLMESYITEVGEEPNYPDYYAGAYVDSEGMLTVCTTSMAKKIKNKIYDATESKEIKIEEKENSYDELLKVKSFIEEKISNISKEKGVLEDICAVAIDDKNNVVVVEVRNLNELKQRNLESLFGDSDQIEYKNRDKDIKPVSKSLSAGMRTYYSSDGWDHLYSIGYKAFRITSSGEFQYGFVTAGHGNSVGYVMKYDGDEIGRITGREFSGSVDASFVQVTNIEYEMTNNIYYTEDVANGGYYLSYLPVGYPVYKVGATTQLTSGEVTYSSITIYYTDNLGTFTDFLDTSLISGGGDSGGLVFAPYDDDFMVAGILAESDDTSSSVCKCGNIEDTMGVYIY